MLRSTGELGLSDGRIIGNRDYVRYYKQVYNTESEKREGRGIRESVMTSAEDEVASQQRSRKSTGCRGDCLPGTEEGGAGEAQRCGASPPLRHSRTPARGNEHEQDPFSPLLSPITLFGTNTRGNATVGELGANHRAC